MTALDAVKSRLSEQKKLGIVCASLMTRMCAACDKSLKVRLHREPNPTSEDCKTCISAAYEATWKEECTCIK